MSLTVVCFRDWSTRRCWWACPSWSSRSSQPAISSSRSVLWWQRESFTCRGNYCSCFPVCKTRPLSPACAAPQRHSWVRITITCGAKALITSALNSGREARVGSGLHTPPPVCSGSPPGGSFMAKCEIPTRVC